MDKDSALVLASAVECPAPGSASTVGATDGVCPTATTEHVAKLSNDEVAALTRSLAAEWKAVLSAEAPGSAETPPPKSAKGPASGYWSEERQRKVRRLVSEPAP